MARKKTDKPAPAPAPAPASAVAVLDVPADLLQVCGIRPSGVLGVAPGDAVEAARKLWDKIERWCEANPSASVPLPTIAVQWRVGEPVALVRVSFDAEA